MEGRRKYRSTSRNFGARRRELVNTTLRPLYTRERPGTHFTGDLADFAAGLDGMENLASTGIRAPDRPICSKSLFWDILDAKSSRIDMCL